MGSVEIETVISVSADNFLNRVFKLSEKERLTSIFLHGNAQPELLLVVVGVFELYLAWTAKIVVIGRAAKLLGIVHGDLVFASSEHGLNTRPLKLL